MRRRPRSRRPCSPDAIAGARAGAGDGRRRPMRERRWCLLALAQYRNGRQAEALRTLRRLRRVLAQELGLDPGPEVTALEQAILRQDDSLLAEPVIRAVSPECPYPGLQPYSEDDADTFFGREEDVARCLERLGGEGVLAIVGPSGSGKSSLARAGVAAALRRQGREVCIVVPGRRPMDSLAGPLLARRRPSWSSTKPRSCSRSATTRRSASSSSASWSRTPLAHPSCSCCAPTTPAPCPSNPRWRGSSSVASTSSARCPAPASGPPSRGRRGRRDWCSSRAWSICSSATSKASPERCRCSPTPCARPGCAARAGRSPSTATTPPAASVAPSPSRPRSSTSGSARRTDPCCAISCSASSRRGPRASPSGPGCRVGP